MYFVKHLTYWKQSEIATFGELNRSSASLPFKNVIYLAGNKSSTAVISVKIYLLPYGTMMGFGVKESNENIGNGNEIIQLL